jgi:hypothetical protein
MIIYSVTIYIKKDVEVDWLEWMKKIHIDDIMKTGHFISSRIFKVIVPSNALDEITYCIQYDCKSLEDYSIYLETDASRLQKEHTLKFQNKVKVARSVMQEI